MADVNSYAAGNCTWWCKNQAGWIPNGWGNAAEWYPRAQQAGFKTSGNPQVGAIAVWGPGVDPPFGFGHCAKVTAVRQDGSFTVSEMNWQGLGKVDVRNVTDRSNLEGFILAPGSQPSDQGDGGIGGAIQQAGGQLVSAGQVAGGGLLVLGALLVAVLLMRR